MTTVWPTSAPITAASCARNVPGRRKECPPQTVPPGRLSAIVKGTYDGDFLVKDGRHAGRRWPAIVKLLAYMTLAAPGAGWLFAHPDALGLVRIAGSAIAASSILALLLALYLACIALDKPHLILAGVRWGRHLSDAFTYSATALITVAAGAGIGCSLYAGYAAADYDVRDLRAAAGTLALMGAGMSLIVGAVIQRPLFSALRGRSLATSRHLAAVSRTLLLVALFTAGAVLAAPRSSLWIPVAASLFLAGMGWEIARSASAENAVRRLLDAATEVKATSSRAGDLVELVGPLAVLENASVYRLLGRSSPVVELEVVMVVRACLERLSPVELRTYSPGSVATEMQQELASWSDDTLRDEIARFMTSLRQTVILRVPLH